MVRSLYSAASGMIGQQANIDTISNNLANVNTTGFKRNRADFEDLIYQTRRVAGTPATELTLVPVGEQFGNGVRVAATQKLYTQGALQQTDSISDMAIEGEGFFRVVTPDGSFAYTRDGSFKIDENGQFVTSNGYRLSPEVILPEDFDRESVSVSREGQVSVRLPGDDVPIEVGQIQLYRFVNPAGLSAIGDNALRVTQASGEAIPGTPGIDSMGSVLHQFLEASNVSVVREMVDMIVAQRAYEMNSRAIQTSDTMLGIANSLKR